MVAWTVPPRILVQKPWLKQNQQGFQQAHQGKGQWGGGGGGQQAWTPRKPPPAAPDGLSVDSSARYTGTCEAYFKWKGYGFLTMSQTGIVPNDRLFCHWRNVQSDDRFPFLVKGLEVEF